MNATASTAVIERTHADVSSLDEFAETINREHALVERAISTALVHAIRTGEALVGARERFRHGEGWGEWLAAACPAVPYQTAVRYMRLARHRQIAEEAGTVGAALDAIRGAGNGQPMSHPQALKDEAHQLNAEGVSGKEIARRLGVNPKTVYRWVDPKEHKRQIEQQRKNSLKWRRAQAALRQQERERAVKACGGPVAECYSMLRRTAQALDRAHGQVESSQVRAGLSAAMSRIHAAEDEIVHALGLGAK